MAPQYGKKRKKKKKKEKACWEYFDRYLDGGMI